MKKIYSLLILVPALLLGCASAQSDSNGASFLGANANDFNPYINQKLPNTRQLSASGSQMLDALGAKAQTIQEEAKHRKNWREEIYPVVFGDRKAPEEIIVLLNFANPDSQKVWQAVAAASKSLSPKECKIVVLGKSDENYGTDLMGFAIWLAHSRPGQAMPWLTYSLQRWNQIKAAQKQAGGVKKFNQEYDATATPQDFPILQSYMARIQPPISQKQELAIARYAYDAGNVNMYQANQISQYYGVSRLPAVIVNGKQLKNVTTENILAALRSSS